GIYPSLSILQHTAKPRQYKIPDNYKIKTTWGKPNKEITIIASINYIDQKPIYNIKWVNKKTHKEEKIYSDKSSSNAASLFSKKYNEGKKTEYSGPEIFGLQLEPVEKEDRANKIAKLEYQTFEEKCKDLFHSNDNPTLRSIIYELPNQIWTINYHPKNKIQNKQVEEIVYALDQGNISQESYRSLAAISYELPREYISKLGNR
ncbi:4453_t:CDS:2, partial [Racocetra persica]